MKSLAWRDLEGVFGFLEDHRDFVFLDTSRPDRENHTSLLFTDPVARLRCHSGADVGHFLRTAEDWLRQGVWLAGWFDYDFGGLLEERIAFDRGSAEAPSTLADLGVYHKPYVYDHATGIGDLPVAPPPTIISGWRINGLQPNIDHAEYLQAIRRLRNYIAAGHTYQVNYTLKLLFSWTGSVEALYRDLRHNQTVPFGAYIRRDNERILSFSPELFFRRDGRELTVRPMKGTSRRGRTVAEDRQLHQDLAIDPKNRSENVMIVDLLRNDLARFVHRLGGGTVSVSSLFDVESYESLLQMTSTVKACPDHDRGGADFSLYELFHALFPCGSVTGAPKIRTMEIINELEKERRGVYTGAIGYLAPDGDAVFSVPIRTVVLRGGRGEMGIGSVIIIDSDPELEWQECLLKGRFLSHCRPGFELLTTMLWQPGAGYWCLGQHLARLARSAAEMCFAWPAAEIRQRLERQATTFSGRCMRVRLTLARDGAITIAVVPCEAPVLLRLPVLPERSGPGLPEVGFSLKVVDGDSPWLRHKTTCRELYDREFRAGREQGLFDLLFVNRRGEVTEGCISNIVIYGDGCYRTPSLTSGLLPGVMRGQLLQDRDRPVIEAILTPADVAAAEAIFVCNAVRGLVQVELRQEGGKAGGGVVLNSGPANAQSLVPERRPSVWGG